MKSMKIFCSNWTEYPIVWTANYVASGEAYGKAGAYGIQGRAAAWVEYIAGSYSGIMGLPLYETARLLEKA